MARASESAARALPTRSSPIPPSHAPGGAPTGFQRLVGLAVDVAQNYRHPPKQHEHWPSISSKLIPALKAAQEEEVKRVQEQRKSMGLPMPVGLDPHAIVVMKLIMALGATFGTCPSPPAPPPTPAPTTPRVQPTPGVASPPPLPVYGQPPRSHSVEPCQRSVSQQPDLRSRSMLRHSVGGAPQSVPPPQLSERQRRHTMGNWQISPAAVLPAVAMSACTTWHSVATLPVLTTPALHSFWGGARRFNRYRIVNPRTGEEVGPLRTWARPRFASHLRILNPGTGLEVAPEGTAAEKNFAPGSETTPQRSLPGLAETTPKSQVDSGLPSTPPGSVGKPQEGARSRRSSFASEAFQESAEDIDWTLEPPNGSYWDWPLSREEKKMRVQMLDQVALYDELERFRSLTTSKECLFFRGGA